MSPNVILRGADFALTAERAPGAPEATYVSECLLCRAESGIVDYDLKPVAVWSIEHTRHYGLDHGQFLVTSQQHWRVGPAPITVSSTRPPPATHARPREAAARLPFTVLVAFLVCCVCVLLSAAR